MGGAPSRLVLASLLLLATALIGTLAATYFIVRQAAATQQALLQSERNLVRAEASFRQARSVVEHFGVFAAERLAGVAGAEPLRRELLDDTLRYYRSFIRQADHDPRLTGRFGGNLFQVRRVVRTARRPPASTHCLRSGSQDL